MKFRISRTSEGRGQQPKPCKNATLEGDKWYIELNTLDELVALAKEVDEEIIIGKDNDLEIYNDYRES
jgi:hypothetical protein